MPRNRAEGWQHAKITGHQNEQLIAEFTVKDETIQNRLLACAHLSGVSVESVGFGGLCESDVECILGGRTKSKTDMWLNLSNGKRLNVSLKKDEGGQVFLIGIDRFLEGFQRQYGKVIPDIVCRAIALYFGSAPDTEQIIEQYGGKNKKLELRKHRLVADTLRAYDPALYDCLLQWMNENSFELFDFCFARGLASKPEDWAHIVWYKNMIGEKQFDTMLYLPDLRNHIPRTAEYGTRNGGSTIQLPFGFVQWHSPRKVIPGNLQFHHSYRKVITL